MILQTILIFITLISLHIVYERISPKIAGIISGIPTGSAITVLIIAINEGSQFASISAINNLSMVPALIVFLIAYWLIGCIYTGYYSSIITVTGSLLAYIACGTIVYSVPVDWRISAFISAAFAIITHHLFQKIRTLPISKNNYSGVGEIISRSTIATTIISFIVYISSFLGPEITGIISAFPMTLMPLLIITRYTHGIESTLTIIKNVPSGVTSLIVYMICVFYLYPNLGIVLGTILATLLSAMTLIIFIKIRNKLEKYSESINDLKYF